MKIAYILSEFPVLSETFILNEIVEVIKNGHKVEIFSLSKPTGDLIHKEIDEYKLLEKTHYFSDFSVKSILKINLLTFLKNFLRLVKFNIGGIIFHPKRVYYNLKLAYFATIIQNFDIIHSHFATYSTTVAMQISRVTGKPFTFTMHGYDTFIDLYAQNLREKIDNSATVFTPSIFNKNYIISKTQCDESKIKVIHATINPKKFERKIKKENNQIKILTVARLVEQKGIEYLIKSMKIVTEKYPDIVLNIGGDGPLRNELKNLVDINNLQENINFLGPITDESYVKELETSTIVALPCTVAKDNNRDVCPLTLQEAMSMEVPVVSTDIASIPELIDNGKSGILVPEKDEKTLAEAIIKLIENPDLGQKMGKEGRKKILNEFNIELQVKKLIDVWKQIH